MAKTEVRSEQIGAEQVKRSDLNVSLAGSAVTAKIIAGAGISLSSTGADVGTGDVTVSVVDERVLMMGVGGAISATVTDGADFLVVVPFNMTLKRMKVSRKTHGSSASVVQVRRSTNSGSSYSDAFGSATFSSTGLVATSDPTDLNIDEGDVVNFSVSTGGGTNLLVELIGIPR